MPWQRIWYQGSRWAYFLWPLSALYYFIITIRRYCYRWGLKKTTRFSPVVIVVGNVSVGGTGKSPMVAYLAALLAAQGFKVGLVSRGYKGQATSWPQCVTCDSDPHCVGDEALMLVKQTQCPMMVGPDRVAAVDRLLSMFPVDCVISDDGLQHYALARDIELIMVDATRGMGNGFLLPAGPLRESSARLKGAPFVISNGELAQASYQMAMQLLSVENLVSGESCLLSDFSQQSVCVVTGIGNPDRFIATLLSKVKFSSLVARTFSDHHRYQRSDFSGIDESVIFITEKDAVKCRRMADERFWVVKAKATLSPMFDEQFLRAFRCAREEK